MSQRTLRIDPYIPDRVEYLLSSAGSWATADIGKPVKFSGDQVTLCAADDEIYGFINSVEPYTSGGHTVSGIAVDVNREAQVRDEAGTLAVGDFVVAGTATAVATATPANGPNVKAVSSPVSDSRLIASGALAIKAGGSGVVKAGAAFYALANGVLLTKAANTDMAALAGTVDNADFNVYAFFVSSAGALTSAMGTAGATLAAVIFPRVPAGTAMIGFVVINPTGTGDFVGGTTVLDDATVVPNAVYQNTVGPFAGTPVHRWQVVAVYSSGAGRKALVRKV